MTRVKGTLAVAAGSVLLLISSAILASPQFPAGKQPTTWANAGPAATAKKNALEKFRRSPMSFEANLGQTDKRIKFIARGAGYTLFLTANGAEMKLQTATPITHAPSPAAQASVPSMPYIGSIGAGVSRSPDRREKTAILNLQVVGADPAAQVTAIDRQPNTSNYFIGNDHSKWRTNVPNFGKVRYAGVYPGIDLIYYGNQQQLEYDFVVAPGADCKAIALHLGEGPDGTKKLSSTIDSSGDLVTHLENGNVRFHKPVIYQPEGQTRKRIDGRYFVRRDGQVGFEVGAYDRSKQLVIDPTLSYSSYLGGSNTDVAMGVALDSFGDAYITGSTLSTDFPTESPLQGINAGNMDIFISKFDTLGGSLDYSTYVGGSGDDVANDILLDNLGDMTVTGYTLSANFPLQLPIQSKFGGGSVTGDAFLFQIASHGTALVYSTYLGGSSDDEGFSLALDSSNNVYVAGFTSSKNFPVVPKSLHTTCGATAAGVCSNGFVLKVTVPPGQNQQTSLAYSTYLGGSGGLGDAAYGIWVDNVTVPPPGNAYVVGITGSPNFPVTKSAFDRLCGTDGKCNGSYDGFVSELNPTGNGLVFSTYLGGSGYDYAAGIAVDSSGVYVSGNTTSTNFPITSGAAQKTFGGMSSGCVPSNTKTCGDVTLTKLNPAGSGLLYSTYLGGGLDENPGLSLALDPGGSVYVTGQTDSTNFPLVTPLQGHLQSGATSNVFLTKLNPEGTAFSYSTYVGGSSTDSGSRVALDSLTAAYVAGTTTSANFPVTVNPLPFQSTCASCSSDLSDAFAFKLSTSANLSISASGPATATNGSKITYPFTVGNSGPDDASVITITDTLPTTLEFSSATVTPSGSCYQVIVLGAPPVVTCTVGYQAVGARIRGTMEFTIVDPSGATITNSIQATAANDSNTATSTIVTTNLN